MTACVNPVTFPLSSAQMEIWLAQHLKPSSPVYNICQFMEIHGKVDPVLFEAAMQQVVAETESLRLQFTDNGDGLRQYVGSPDWSLSFIDVSLEADPQVAAEAWMRADYEQPSNFPHSPLFSYALLKLAADRFFWYQRCHHITIDGIGGALIAQRMAQVYSMLVNGVATQEPPSGPVSLLLENDARYRTSVQFTKDRAYWLARCTNWPEPVTLANRQAPALHYRLRQTAHVSSQAVLAYASDANRLAQLMMAAMATYLHRWTGAQDVVLGLPVPARFGDDRRIPGTVANILPIRLNVQPETNLSSLMEQAAQEIQHGFRHQRYRFEELQRELGLTHGQPLFGTTINLMPFDYDLSFGEHSSTNHNLLNGPVEDLMVAIYTLPKDSLHPLRLDFDANPTLYTADELRVHQRRFCKLLDALVTEPTQPIGDIDLLNAEERQQLLVEWNATAAPYPAHQCIHQLFEEQVKRIPEATALIYEHQVFSYAELNTCANRLAHQLIKLGVQPDARVAICVERSPAMVVGVLAILKAGGAYVPLDPAYPSERLTHILADATPTLLLADATGRAALGEVPLASLNVLDPNNLLLDANNLPQASLANPQVPGLTSRHLAYVIYTSGSTGTPKGVMMEHRSIVNLAQASIACFDVHPSSRVLQFASISFDVSIWEIITALGGGAGLYLPTDTVRHDRHALWDYLAQQAITHVTLPPALLQGGEDLPRLNLPLTLILTGEAPSVALLQTLHGQGIVFNAYGPTETHAVTVWPAALSELNHGVLSIGRPIANIRLYLLDAHSQPVPLGAVGELYIGGEGVARGYLNRPKLTAERFLPDPFSDLEEARMYKTGDLARYLPDGNLEFLGRNDHQVKIRGFRIELGEIEACLVEHPQVREAAAFALGEGHDKRLIAYIVAEPDEQLVHTLRAHLSTRLPEYMMPAAFVRLDALPLTPNGKLDRQALPAPDDEAFARQSYEAPQSEIEIALAAIWAELLKVEKISRHDSFFALGGHSLLAVRLMNRVAALGAELPLAALFASPCLAAFAAAVNECLTQSDSALPAITPVSREGVLPLSFAQQRLWFLAQLDGVSDTYHIPVAIRLRGTLNRTAWQHALNTLLARHEALRSVFVTIDGQPQVQLLAAGSGLPMRWHDLREDPNANAKLESLITEEAYAPFDLAQGPLIRARLLQLANEEHVFLLTQHHIISDGWSLGVLWRELSALYVAYQAGEHDPLPPLTIQYPDYAAWQRQWFSGERLQTQSAYWRTTLAGAPVLIDLPTDRPRPSQQSFAGAQVPVRLDAQMTHSLKRLSQAHGVTLFMTLLAAWSAVLSRLAGQDDIVIGTPSANRSHREIEPLIGFFVNTLALRIDLSGEPNTMQLLERVQHRMLAAHAHQDLPFEQVVEIAQPPRKLGHTPLFQVMFSWQNNEIADWHLPALEGSLAASSYNTVKFDLELNLQEVDDEIVGELRYATALFDPQTIKRQVGYLHAMLRAMTNDAQQAVSTVDLLAPAERTLLLETWNSTVTPYPTHQCIHQLFEEQVERTPHATALVYEEQALSYAELNARANRLAHRLIELGVKPEMRVAICIERSPAMVVGLLAILKAGGAYVPLDPAYPGERLTHILVDAAPSILLADTAGRSALGEAALASLTVLDPNELPAQAQTNPHVSALTSHHLAYVIYTSGSTGRPKGVMVEHAQIVRLFDATESWYHFNQHDTWCLFHSFAFDVSVWELWGALRYGGKLVLVPQHIARSPQEFYHLVCEQGVTVLNQTPSAFKPLIVCQAQSELRDRLRYVIFAGETLEPAILQAWYASRSERSPQLVNMYGTTETTVHVTYRPLQPHDSDQIGSPIGIRIPDLKVYLLDANSQPVPLGAIGELYIGGGGVVRGYLNRPELTAERFLSDPFSDCEDARIYKTGDLARYLPDGNLEFLGRNDHQVKIRGFRIEPGEIEARLIEHPQVQEAVVLALGEGHAKRLVAYVVAEPDTQLAHTLRSHLAARLPEYMMPAAFVRLDALPLTPNGKLDRRALPAPDEEAFAHQVYEAPQGEIETTLAGIWTELLGVEQVSRHDSFFALGGHSLLAVQMIERLRRFGLTVSVRALFETPTLNGLAQSLGQHKGVVVPPNLITPSTTTLTPNLLPLIDLTQTEIDCIVAQTPGGVANIQDIYALSPLQDGILFHHLLTTEGDPYLLTVQMAFADRERLDRYLDAVQQVVNRHDILRTAFVWNGLATPAQVVWRQASLSITELTLDPIEGLITEQLSQHFDPRRYRIDLTQAPLLRFAIAQNSDGRWLLVQLLHHLISDHATLEEMQIEIQAFLADQGDALPTPQPFRNLVAQARLGLSQEVHERFFTEMLAEVDEPTLPFGLAEIHRDGSQVLESNRMLSQDLNDRLRAQAKRLGVSLASLCHLAWAQVLARVSGQQRVVFGTILFGRMQAGAGTDRAMGLFINTLPLRIDLDDCSVQDSVYQAHKRLAALLEHEHASLALAQRCSGVPAGAPLFSALLNYRHNAMPSGESPTLPGIEFLGAQERTNYPFTLSVEDFGSALGLTAQVVQPLDPARVCGYMQQTLQSLVEALECAPDRPLWQLEVLPSNERECLLKTWNMTATPYPEHQCIHQLFEEQVKRTPEATALVYEDQVLSYTELNARANRLAHQLIELGVQPDARVAICVERSPAMLVGLLAILKAGGAYVPLDPDYPEERLAHILADAAPSILLADVAGHTALSEAALTSLIVLDPNQLSPSPITNPQVPELTSRHLAYVIYTSGSTGSPKGVMVEHRNLVNLAQAQTANFDIHPSSRVLQFTSISFDVSAAEIFMTLGCGAGLYLSPDTARRDRHALWEYSIRQAITHITLPPALLQNGEDLPNLSTPLTLILGGEAPSTRLLESLRHHRVVVFNTYGPTETTVCATVWHCSGPLSNQEVPIGRPIVNTQLYLLDTHGQPVPLGAAGELYIGGVGVARGYLNRPELTAERFLPDPFSQHKDAWMYKTGDLARYLSDGNLVFLGRNDHQVKIRGFRIELGEIEAVLQRHSTVAHAAVSVREDLTGHKQLVGYVVPTIQAQSELDPAELRQYLARELPSYMVPAAIVPLHALPLTPNGKLDQQALPAPEFATHNARAPRTPQEAMLVELFAEVLGLSSVSIDDSFFELGGDSILSIRLVSRARKAGLMITPRDIFRYPSVAELASAHQLEHHHAVDQYIDLHEVAQLDEDIFPPRNSQPENQPRAILLTGATGFVGRFLLRQLLDDTQAQIFCLVRTHHADHGKQRIINTLRRWRLWKTSDERRIEAIPGDLRLPKAGINSHDYSRLCQEVEVIYHNGTSMNHLESFEMARAANVEGVKALLRIATTHTLKTFNYISTLGVFTSNDRSGESVIDEFSSITGEKHFYTDGYNGSKWAGEQLTHLAHARGVPCNIFRLGLVTGDSQQGRYDESQWLHRLLKSCEMMGVGFNDVHSAFDIVPVDYVCKSIVHLANCRVQGGGVFHLASMQTVPLSEIFTLYNSVSNVGIHLVSYQEWLEKLSEMYEQGHILPITPYIQHDLIQGKPSHQKQNTEPSPAKILFDCSYTHSELSRAGINFPQLDAELFNIYMQGMGVGLAPNSAPAVKHSKEIEHHHVVDHQYIDLNQAAQLDEDIFPPGNSQPEDQPRAILLTGATGFVGRFLLRQLLDDTQAQIFCLVRTHHADHGKQRIINTLRRWRLWKTSDERRIEVIPGDLSLPKLGINRHHYSQLCREIDAIYHSGTSMNHRESFEMARTTNVDGVKALLRIATSHKLKTFNYVSTLGVFTPHDRSGECVIDEFSSITEEKHLHIDGYNSSKWVAEQLTHLAHARGVPCNIFRPGLVIADSQQGRHDESQWLHQLFKSWEMMGAGFNDMPLTISAIPVDYVCKSIAYLSSRYARGGGVFHLASTKVVPLSEMFTLYNTVSNVGIDLISSHEWIGKLLKRYEQGQILPITSYVQDTLIRNRQSPPQQKTEANPANLSFNCSHTHSELRNAGIHIPQLDAELFNVYMQGMGIGLAPHNTVDAEDSQEMNVP